MPVHFFNTLSREVEEFHPIDGEGAPVRLYTCGPTVYDFAHIGNFRAYVFEDLLQRHLEARGYAVRRVMNLTDVDDKTIRGCRAAGVALADFTAPFKKAFFEDLGALRIKPAQDFPEATAANHIGRMIAMIGELIGRGHGYQAEDGSIYFRIHTFPAYGRLAHLNLDELRPSGRVRSDEYEKESVGDFALWKARVPEDGDVWWESPWGQGRPGWHIECSAMATGLLGPQIDIHCGGVDNIFPHHEAEIAQSECVTGLAFVRYWLHCAHLMVEGGKMAKSAGNFYTLRDLIGRGWSGREIRYLLISAHYRVPLNFTFDGLAAARSALQRLDEWSARLDGAGPAQDAKALPEGLAGDGFLSALDDDLNISAALGHLFDTVRESNRLLDEGALDAGQIRSLIDYRDTVNRVLDLAPDETAIPAEIQALLDERSAVRARKEWAASDSLRDRIAEFGWIVKDTKDGQKLTRKP